MSVSVTSPSVGTVLEVLVEAGESVKEGDEILIIESMKMEIPVTAPQAGTIESIDVAEGASVQADDVVAKIA